MALDAEAAAARTARDGDLVSYDALYGAYVSGAENYGTTTQDLQGLGLDPAVETTYGIAIPLDLTAKYDPTTLLVTAHVKSAAGDEALRHRAVHGPDLRDQRQALPRGRRAAVHGWARPRHLLGARRARPRGGAERVRRPGRGHREVGGFRTGLRWAENGTPRRPDGAAFWAHERPPSSHRCSRAGVASGSLGLVVGRSRRAAQRGPRGDVLKMKIPMKSTRRWAIGALTAEVLFVGCNAITGLDTNYHVVGCLGASCADASGPIDGAPDGGGSPLRTRRREGL